jgi:hypothetical protein
MKKKGYAVEYCDHCKEIEKVDRLITFNQMEWLIVAGFCRMCEAYEVMVEK